MGVVRCACRGCTYGLERHAWPLPGHGVVLIHSICCWCFSIYAVYHRGTERGDLCAQFSIVYFTLKKRSFKMVWYEITFAPQRIVTSSKNSWQMCPWIIDDTSGVWFSRPSALLQMDRRRPLEIRVLAPFRPQWFYVSFITKKCKKQCVIGKWHLIVEHPVN